MTKAGLLASAATFVALAALPAFAQEATTNTTTGTTVQSGQQVLVEQDSQFAAALAANDLKEIRAGELAAQRAQSAEVKQFGQHMVEDHTKSSQKLQPIAQAKGIELPAELGDIEDAGEDFVEGLNGREGWDFDNDYMQQMVKDHEAAVLLLEQEIQLGQDAELKALAEQALPIVQGHLEMAKGLATTIAQQQPQDETQTQAAADVDTQPAVGAATTQEGTAADANQQTTAQATAETDRRNLNEMTADDLIGDRVVNASGEDIGEINDIVLDKDKAAFALIDVGGFLGVGEKQVAVPFDRLQLHQEGQAILMSNVTEDELKELPAWQEGEDWAALPRGRRILDETAGGVTGTAEGAAQGVATTAENAAEGVTEATQDAADATQDTAADLTNAGQNPLGDRTAADLIGQRVLNTDGRDLGEISDVVFDQNNKQAVFAVVDVGGFLGIGEKSIAIPFERLQMQGDQVVLQATVTEDELKTLPDFDEAMYAAFPRDVRIADQWEGDTSGVARQNTQGAGATDPNAVEPAAGTDDAGAAAGADQTGMAADTQIASTGDAAVDQLGQLTADELIGDRVVNANGENIGEINDIVLSKDKAVFALIDVGGFLGIGEKQVAVPFDRLQLQQDGQAVLMSNVTEDELKELPAWQEGTGDFEQFPRDQQLRGNQ